MTQTFNSSGQCFSFGKHKGQTLDDVISSSPQYILWACDHSIISVPEKEYENAKKSYNFELDCRYGPYRRYKAIKNSTPHRYRSYGDGFDDYLCHMDFVN